MKELVLLCVFFLQSTVLVVAQVHNPPRTLKSTDLDKANEKANQRFTIIHMYNDTMMVFDGNGFYPMNGDLHLKDRSKITPRGEVFAKDVFIKEFKDGEYVLIDDGVICSNVETLSDWGIADTIPTKLIIDHSKTYSYNNIARKFLKEIDTRRDFFYYNYIRKTFTENLGLAYAIDQSEIKRFSTRTVSSLGEWRSLSSFDPQLLLIPKEAQVFENSDSIFNTLFDTIPSKKNTKAKGGGEPISKNETSEQSKELAYTIPYSSGSKPGTVVLNGVASGISLSQRMAKLKGLCGSVMPQKCDELTGGYFNKDYVITNSNKDNNLYLFPELEIGEDQYNLFRQFVKYKNVFCNNRSVRVGIAVRIKVVVQNGPSALLIKNLENIKDAVDKFNLIAYYSITLFGVSDSTLLTTPSALFNSEGYKKAYEAVDSIFKNLNNGSAKIEAQVLGIN